MNKNNRQPGNLLALAGVAIGILFLSACASQPKNLRDPAYAPVISHPAQAVPNQTGMVTPSHASVASGSIYSPSTSRFLFEDYRARRVGDVLTVILQEKTKAAKKASTATKKKNAVAIKAPTLMGHQITHNGKQLLSAEMDGSVDFGGEGDSSQSNSLAGEVTVTVAQVLANGNLLVRGEKLLYLNQGSEVVRIRGMVRPSDIRADNTIYSNQIANAEITYKGEGVIADSNEAGWLTRFFNSKWWPM